MGRLIVLVFFNDCNVCMNHENDVKKMGDELGKKNDFFLMFVMCVLIMKNIKKMGEDEFGNNFSFLNVCNVCTDHEKDSKKMGFIYICKLYNLRGLYPLK